MLQLHMNVKRCPDLATMLYIDNQLIDAEGRLHDTGDQSAPFARPSSPAGGERCDMLRVPGDAKIEMTQYAHVPLQRRFEVIAQTTPCAKAVSSNGRFLTYGELDAQADALAMHLQGLGLQPGSFCLIDLPPSLARVRGILAVLKAGAICLQCDRAITGSAAVGALSRVRPAIRLAEDAETADRPGTGFQTIRCADDAPELPYGWPDEVPVDGHTPASAHATLLATGQLRIHLRTHYALSLALDNDVDSRQTPCEHDLIALFQTLSRGAFLTVAAEP